MIICDDTGEKAYNYKQYLQTKHWLLFRKTALTYYKHCQACNGSKYLQVHHVKYDNIGKECTDDVTVLCMYCHDELHHKRMERAENILNATKKFVDWNKVEEEKKGNDTNRLGSKFVCPKCKLSYRKNIYKWVTFINGMVNIQINCSKCNKFIGYAPQQEPYISIAKKQREGIRKEIIKKF